MKYLERAITDAIAGGWEPVISWEDFVGINRLEGTGVVLSFKGNREFEGEMKSYESSVHITWGNVFMSPDFWIALGKARGWTKRDSAWAAYDAYFCKGEEWKFYWHRFIKHLASRHTLESWFAELYKDDNKSV